MKLKTSPLLALLLLSMAIANAQVPEQMNYQAVVRNAGGTPLANGSAVSLRFTIHDATPTGTSVFTETQNTTTNQFGVCIRIIIVFQTINCRDGISTSK